MSVSNIAEAEEDAVALDKVSVEEADPAVVSEEAIILEEEEMVEEAIIPEEEASIKFLKQSMDKFSLLWMKALESNITQIRPFLTISLTGSV